MARPEKLTIREILQIYQPPMPTVVQYWPRREIWMLTKVVGDVVYGFRPGAIADPLNQKLSLDGERQWVFKG